MSKEGKEKRSRDSGEKKRSQEGEGGDIIRNMDDDWLSKIWAGG